MYYLFLDIDGVLNNFDTKERVGIYCGIDRSLVDVFQQVMLQLQAKFGEVKIILSSDWRYSYDNGVIVYDDIFRKTVDTELARIGLHIDGITPVLKRGFSRGIEIQNYMRVHGVPNGYVVLDDVYFPDFDYCFINRHFLNTFESIGLTEEHIPKILQLMGTPLEKDEIEAITKG